MTAAAQPPVDPQDAVQCPLSQRADGQHHTWHLDSDTFTLICQWCDEVRDVLTGYMIKEGRRDAA